jgi:uncharacterized damage-inducible protein DinB
MLSTFTSSQSLSLFKLVTRLRELWSPTTSWETDPMLLTPVSHVIHHEKHHREQIGF